MITEHSLIYLTLTALIPVVNPPSTVPLFLSITSNLTVQERNRQALLACIYMFCILFAFLVTGTWIIEFFGISVPAIRIAGGLIIGFIGFRMLFPQEVVTSEAREKAVTKKDVAFTPLAMPSLAGPGSISVVLTVSGDNTQAIAYFFIGIGILTMAIICYCVLRAASWVKDRFGAYGIDAMTRIMGFLLICIAVQFIHLGVSVWIRETLKALN